MLVPTTVVAGGDALARGEDGKVVFVRGGLPGEPVRVRVVESKKGFSRAEIEEVVEPSPWRTEPPCPNVARGCGGCQWQHVTLEGQRELKAEIVRDALRRIAKLTEPPVRATVALSGTDYRTTMRAAVDHGRAGLRRAGSHDVVDLDLCLVAHPLVEEMLRDGRFGRAREVELRAGARTGTRLAMVDPDAQGVQLPDDVVVVGIDDVRAGDPASYSEIVADRTWRISAASFFQARPDGADELARLVVEAVEPYATAVDLYCGVGLFAGVLSDAGVEVLAAVEGDASSARDARANLAESGVDVVEVDVHRWTAEAPVDVVVADPSRNGLGTRGVEAAVSGVPEAVVLVSCDPAALGRDTQLLGEAGYGLEWITPVDMFPGTVHVETVARFTRGTADTQVRTLWRAD
ncbi:MAG: SAM-dependent methyltransferase, tRNA(uracil-5)-methyltransferase [Actinomycetia bacterium]|nr:SAM-dependent methyltransferase, tRNA(uracil-5)-methyltransferase [Actinomycetes bacterium]